MSAAAISAAFAGQRGGFALDVAFAVPMRGITGLFGPSGSGKTTVLRCIAGLERMPGRLSVGDAVWQDDGAGVFLPPHRRPVGYVFQEASLFPHLSVRRNLAYGARRATRDAGTLAFDEVVALLGVGPLLDRAPGMFGDPAVVLTRRPGQGAEHHYQRQENGRGHQANDQRRQRVISHGFPAARRAGRCFPWSDDMKKGDPGFCGVGHINPF